MSYKGILSGFAILLGFGFFQVYTTGCAQIGMPTGGDRDSLAPKLVHADPDEYKTNFKDNKITFTFNEFVEIQDIQNNLLVSPLPKDMPVVSSKLKTVTIKLKDTLLENTTYTIKLGNAIKDINEGNELKDFFYVFSTGNILDSLTIGGKIINAETGLPDSTSIAMLYRNADDSSVQKIRPNYIAKPNGKGEFLFENLPPASYKIYSLKDGDGGKTYNSKSELFAFTNKEITSGINKEPIVLYNFALEKEKPKTTTPKAKPEKKLRYTHTLSQGKQDLLDDFKIVFNNFLRKADTKAFVFSDTNYKPISQVAFTLDSTNTTITLKHKWKENEIYKLIIPKEAFTDTLGNSLAKTDTITIKANAEKDYGSITIRFANIDFAKNPVLQFIQNDAVKYSYSITANEWSEKLFHTGEYELRVLYDENKNGIWDTGNYATKKQPEKVTAISGKLNIKANWDNEKEIKL